MSFRALPFVTGLVAGIALLCVGLLVRRTLSPQGVKQFQLRDDILVHGNPSLKEIALTFDDGPHPETMRSLLNLLGKEKVRATFFLVGKQIEKHPAIVRRMLAEGHEVGNHSHTHPRLDGMSLEAIREEMANCAIAFHRATGAYMHLFRPPGMRYDDGVIDTAQDLGYVTVHWNAAAQDFKPTDPAVIEAKILRTVRDGSVILLHDHPDTIAAMPNILRRLKEKGYRFVTVSQMLGRLQRPVFAKSNAYTGREIVESAVRTPRPSTAPRPAAKDSQRQKPVPKSLPKPDSIATPRGIDIPTDAGG